MANTESSSQRIWYLGGAAAVVVCALLLFWIYGTDTHHSSRSTIWWTERGRNLIPPAATDITLRQDMLDHYVVYTIRESDLNDFLNTRFAREGEVLDSYAERSPVKADRVGVTVGPLDWVFTEDTVTYSYAASNGGTHDYYHDTKTGRTYQKSAYW